MRSRSTAALAAALAAEAVRVRPVAEIAAPKLMRYQ